MNDFKVRCVRSSNDGSFTRSKTYEIKDGYITFDDGSLSAGQYRTIEQLNLFFGSQFELVTEPKQFTKADLRTGMRVELKNSLKMVIMLGVSNGDVMVNSHGDWMPLNRYSDDMKIIQGSKDYNIVKVCEASVACYLFNESKLGKLLYQRIEPKKYTIVEVEAALTEVEGKPVEIVKG